MRKGGLRVYWHLLSACLELYTWWETNIKKEMSTWLQPLLEGCLLFIKVVHHGIFMNSILKYGLIISQIWLCIWFFFSSRWDISYRILLCWSVAIERKNTWRIRRSEEAKAGDQGCALVDFVGCLLLFVSSPAFSPPLSLLPYFIIPLFYFPFIENGFFSPYDIFWLWSLFPLLPIPPHLPFYADPPPSYFLSNYNINRLLRDNICLSIHLSTYLSIKTLYYQNRTKQNKQTKEMSVGNRYRFRDWLIDIFRKPNKNTKLEAII